MENGSGFLFLGVINGERERFGVSNGERERFSLFLRASRYFGAERKVHLQEFLCNLSFQQFIFILNPSLLIFRRVE